MEDNSKKITMKPLNDIAEKETAKKWKIRAKEDRANRIKIREQQQKILEDMDSKEEQKQHLINIMEFDEKLGLYNTEVNNFNLIKSLLSFDSKKV